MWIDAVVKSVIYAAGDSPPPHLCQPPPLPRVFSPKKQRKTAENEKQGGLEMWVHSDI